MTKMKNFFTFSNEGDDTTLFNKNFDITCRLEENDYKIKEKRLTLMLKKTFGSYFEIPNQLIFKTKSIN